MIKIKRDKNEAYCGSVVCPFEVDDLMAGYVGYKWS